ncbi:MAG TPA: methanol oxidation system protein MoxJ [Hansschlegelia sp.]
MTALNRGMAGAAILAILGMASWTACAAESGDEKAAGGGSLRVCASTVEAPYSMADGKGFENRIAALVAEAMGRKIEFVWSKQPAIYQVRDGLDKNLCDVVLGVDEGDERVLTTKPYFRTGYVFVTRTDEADIGPSWKDAGKSDFNRFAVRFQTPAELMLKRLGKYEENVSYGLSLVNFEDKRNKYTQVAADKLVSEVASGNADVAIAFGSDVGPYVRTSSKPLKVTMIEDDFSLEDGTKVPLHFNQAMGVRKDDEDLAKALDAAIEKARPQIDDLLKAEGIPVLAPNT